MQKSSSKKRLDIILVERGLVENRSKASEIIKRGKVKVDGKIISKSGKLIKCSSLIEIAPEAFPYVGRGGEKLNHALKEFKINVRNKICLDVGSSTGGFVDCLLKSGAKLVYAVDVGRNQLHPRLKNDKRVLSFEGTDIRNFSLPNNKRVDLISVDVSFISTTLILPVIKKFLRPNGDVIILIKPQFEVGEEYLNKKGIVKDEKIVKVAIEKILKKAFSMGFFPVNFTASPIKGKEGNQEYLLHLKLSKSEYLKQGSECLK